MMEEPVTWGFTVEFFRWLITTHPLACIIYYIFSLIMTIVLFRDEDRTMRPERAIATFFFSPLIGGVGFVVLLFWGIYSAIRFFLYQLGVIIARALESIGRAADAKVERITRREIQRDEAGILYESWIIGKRVRHISVEDETGRYLICVPPSTESALSGVAWSYGINPEDYQEFLDGKTPLVKAKKLTPQVFYTIRNKIMRDYDSS